MELARLPPCRHRRHHHPLRRLALPPRRRMALWKLAAEEERIHHLRHEREIPCRHRAGRRQTRRRIHDLGSSINGHPLHRLAPRRGKLRLSSTATSRPTICNLASIAGGTDLNGCFVGGNPMGPVFRGEIQCLQLGMDVHAYNDNEGNSLIGATGELVCCKAAFPAMPVYLLGRSRRRHEKYHNAYFNQLPRRLAPRRLHPKSPNAAASVMLRPVRRHPQPRRRPSSAPLILYSTGRTPRRNRRLPRRRPGLGTAMSASSSSSSSQPGRALTDDLIKKILQAAIKKAIKETASPAPRPRQNHRQSTTSPTPST